MKKRLFILFAAVLPLLLSVLLTVLFFLSTDDLSLTGIARSDYLLIMKQRPSYKTNTEAQAQDALPIGSASIVRKTYIFEKDLSQGNTKLINLSTVELDPAVLENRYVADKSGEKPTVLILHTHAEEKYAERLASADLPPEAVAEAGNGSNTDFGVVEAGKIFADTLEKHGIRVIHVEYSHALQGDPWEESQKTVAAYLTAYPSIRFVLDIHREIHRDTYGNILAPTTPDGQSAQIEILVGSDRENTEHSEYEKNLALAMTFKERLDEEAPHLSLPVKMVNQTLNQQLSVGYLTLSVGSEGSLPAQIKSGAQRAAAIFAKTIQIQ